MLAISTSWKSKEATNGDTFIELLEGFDITGIELDYRINEVLFRQMREALKRSDLNVVSIHNYFPVLLFCPIRRVEEIYFSFHTQTKMNARKLSR